MKKYFSSFLRGVSLTSVAAGSFFVSVMVASAFGATSSGGPPDGQTGVPLDAYVNRQFDLNLSGATITTGNVLLQRNTGNVQGGTASGTNFCTPQLISGNMIACDHAPLQIATWYSFIMTTGVKTATGMALGAQLRYQFQTTSFAGGGNFIAPPSVLGSVPRAGSVHPINAKIRVYFNPGGSSTGTAMRTSSTGSVLNPANVQIFKANNGQPTGSNLLSCTSVGANPGSPTDCNLSYYSTGSILIITPGKKSPAGTVATTGTALTAGTGYVLIVKGGTGSTGVRNTDNMPLMHDYYVPFTTTGADVVGPDVKTSSPPNAGTAVDRQPIISLGFTEPVDPVTVSGSSVRLYKDNNSNGSIDGGDTLITGTSVEYASDQGQAFLSPNATLASTGAYIILVTSGIRDLAGNALDSDPSTGGNQNRLITFVTSSKINGAASPDTAGPRISIANADNFSISVTFNEAVKFNLIANNRKGASAGNYDVNNPNNWTLESPAGSPVSLAGKSFQYLPSKYTFVIGGLSMPPNGTFKLKAVTSTGAAKIQDLSGNAIDTTGSPPRSEAFGTVKSVFDTGGQPGGMTGNFDFGAHGMNGSSPVVVMPFSPVTSQTTNYRAMLAMAQAIPSGGSISMTFPIGFGFASSCATALTTPDNADINGPSTGVVTIASVACDPSSRTVTIVTGGATTVAGDMLRFEFQGITNTSVSSDPTKDPGSTVAIYSKKATGEVLDSLVSMPFFLGQAGALSIAGTVFNDNGAGGGTSGDGVKNGSEAGVQSIQVCAMGGISGSQCTTTDSNGAYTFSSLGAGHYGITIPPLTSGNFLVQNPYRDLNITSSQSNVNFGLSATTSTITVNVTGIPSGTDLDVFAFNTQSTTAGNIMRTLTYSASSRSVTLPVNAGAYTVGLGPHENMDPSQGGGGFTKINFLPPTPQSAKEGGTVTFALQAASNEVRGHVYTAGGTAIPNAFVMLKPSSQSQSTNSQSDAFGQTQADGSFTIATVAGNYAVQAMVPGAAASAPVPITVTANSSNGDSNTTADVFKGTTLVTNAGSVGAAVNLDLLVTKGSLSIAGSILDENSSGIAYAHVEARKQDTSGNTNGIKFDAPTGTDGSYTLYVDAGTYTVSAFAPGYGFVGSTTVTVTSTSLTGQNIQATAANFGTITGTVTQNGSAKQGVYVSAFNDSGGNGTATAADGTYSLKVKAGTYTVRGMVPGVGPTSTLTSVVVTGGATASSKDLSIGAAGTITVTISGVTNAFVDARDSSGNGNGTTTNTTAGVYSIQVPAGTYTVRANSPASGVIGTQSSVAVTAGATTAVTFTPPTLVTVAGTIASSSTACINGAAVTFSDATSGIMTVALADSSGVFSISLPASKTFAISASKPGCIDSATPGSVAVGTANISGVTRTLTATDSTISGTVSLAGSSYTSKVQVYATTADGKYLFTEASNGTYTLNVPGSSTLSISARADGYATASALSATAGSSTANLTLTALSGYTRQDPLSTSVTPNAASVINNSTIGSKFAVNLPAGALGNGTASATVSTSPTSNFVPVTSSAKVVGNAVNITMVDSDQNAISDVSSAEVHIPYTTADLTAAGVTDASQLVVGTWNDTTKNYDSLPTTVDTTNQVLKATTTHFSTFAAVAAVGGGTTSTSTSTTTSTSGGGGDSGGGHRGGGGGASATRTSPTTVSTTAATSTVNAPVPAGGYLKMSVGGRNVVFRDVPAKEWFGPYVKAVIAAGIASGYKDASGNPKGEFGPADPVTYAQVAKMTLASSGKAVNPYGVPSNRTARSDWSAPYIRVAEDVGLSVYIAKHLDVKAFATRGAVIQTIVEALDVHEKVQVAPLTATGSSAVVQTGSGSSASGASLTVKTATGSTASSASSSSSSSKASVVTFTDLPLNHPDAAAITLAVKLGIISGDTNAAGNSTGTVRPNDSINRAEVAKIFSKLIDLGYVK